MRPARRVLVTGGAGFLGSHLVQHILDEDPRAEVLVVDNFSTGSWLNLRAAQADHPHRLEVMRHDVTFPLYVEVDEIFNLACPASPRAYQLDPVQTTKTCVMGTINMLGLAKRTRAKILQASTSEVYGDPLSSPQDEGQWGNVNPVGLRSCYDEGKRCAESLCFDYRRQWGLPVKVARIFNTYGPRMAEDDGRVVSSFIVAALKREPLFVNGDGSQTRSFCYVDDLVEGLIRLMASPVDFNSPVNLGNPHEVTIGQLAQLVLQLTGSDSNVSYRARPPDDPMRRKPDITLARLMLDGWTPQVGLREGLDLTLDHFTTLAEIEAPAE